MSFRVYLVSDAVCCLIDCHYSCFCRSLPSPETVYRVDGFVALRCVFSAMADCISAKSHALNRAFAIKALNLYFSSFMKSFKQQVYNVFLSRPTRNTCALHLQTRLTGRRYFFTVFARTIEEEELSPSP